MKRILTAIALTTVLVTTGLAGETPSPEGAATYIISPADGAVLTNPVTIRFGLTGMGVAPAGTEMEHTGHHHLLINVDPATLDMDAPLPADDQHIHFGGGQTEFTADLPSGTHTLRIILGDQNHIPHNPPVISEPISITVN